MTVALLLIAGLVLLIVGGELLVRGSVRTAECFGVSPLLIGLTLVGFGTSTPELVTSVQAALIGSPGIAVGNIVGSNLANMLLILGASAVILPLAVQSRALQRDGGFMLAITLLFVGVGFTTGLIRPVGIAFIVLLVGYMYYAYRQERGVTSELAGAERGGDRRAYQDGDRSTQPGGDRTAQPGGDRSAHRDGDPSELRGGEHTAAYERAQAVEGFDPALRSGGRPRPRGSQVFVPLLLALAGLVIIVLGGRVLVDAAVELARLVGLSEEVIGLTIVAAGTSMPELVTSLVAAARKQADVAVGNVLGSNVYNLLGIGGVTALIAPTPVPTQIAQVDAPFMLGITVLLMWFAWTSKRLSRVEGAVFLAFYFGYIGYLIAV